MPPTAPKTNNINVFARWRRLAPSEAAEGTIDYHSTSPTDPHGHLSVSISGGGDPGSTQSWTSPPAFNAIFNPEDDNGEVYKSIVAPAIPHVLRGGSCNFFAYGHSGSGKTHTIIGYDYDDERELGLCLAAARQLFKVIDDLNAKDNAGERLGIGFSLFEMRKKSAFDLLNRRTECHVREGHDGKVHIRGETEMLEGGKVRVCPIVRRPCWSYECFRQELTQAVGARAVGSSSVHSQSSRTHAILELEIICQSLVDARQAVVDRQSELVPVGKRATDISIEEQMKAPVPHPGGKWAPNPDYEMNQERIDAAEAEKAEHEHRVAVAEELVEDILKSAATPCLGAKMVFVDLAGAEYHQEKGAQQLHIPKQTPQERQEGRQINTDLLALKEVMRAWATNQPRIPFRSSALTMVLREHFLSSEKGNSTMIVTVSPAKEQYAATLNSLKYGSLVGVTRA
ncbi:kinesin-like protein [Trichoderma longibrachiatum]|uniref:Kinesin-like protein n=1 Tax=Trichoderma longibrachiatum ATCC 18648 TaxID=983965 RepID=A0A2T4C721_TRILO|nr:kinesin-like protein [Trichoderma longibrachiatum ATCC 18648]